MFCIIIFMYLNIKIQSLDICFDDLSSACEMAENGKNGCFRLLVFVCDTLLSNPTKCGKAKYDQRVYLVALVFNITE